MIDPQGQHNKQFTRRQYSPSNLWYLHCSDLYESAMRMVDWPRDVAKEEILCSLIPYSFKILHSYSLQLSQVACSLDLPDSH